MTCMENVIEYLLHLVLHHLAFDLKMQSDQFRNAENAKFGKIYLTVRSTQKLNFYSREFLKYLYMYFENRS